ncbi:protein kinase [Gloeocapsa sp. PCC 73106]|uniref:protein kinase domain-containing protein n=1 Tax=Gloeocapsa sp. PCC 73106 TaxID=102232 RepID=UPI0002AC640A|nr:protein kinase [Gloeocapsa sp. PCC 73106]ELR99022.1 serine/threonine protein kinase [Gloeocapsa sp. PCC 73106]
MYRTIDKSGGQEKIARINCKSFCLDIDAEKTYGEYLTKLVLFSQGRKRKSKPQKIEEVSIMDTPLKAGEILNSRYRILSLIGHGGFGRTYLAEDLNRFNEHCVIKEFAPRLQNRFVVKKAQELFEREAQVLYRLQHAQIPKFYELFRWTYQDKQYLFLVQEYIEGQTYQTIGNLRFSQGIRCTETEISNLLRQLLPVLEYIHSMGLIHRDISPDNLMLRSTDELAVLIDFGSIKDTCTPGQLPIDCQSSMGTALGKRGYAPPEQMNQGLVGAHTDLYALAATAIVLLTGKKPQELIDPNSYQWHLPEDLALSCNLKWMLTTMLSPEPSDRFTSALEVKRALKKSSTRAA